MTTPPPSAGIPQTDGLQPGIGVDEATAAVIDRDYPVTPVPLHARKSFFSLGVVLLGFTIFHPDDAGGLGTGEGLRLR